MSTLLYFVPKELRSPIQSDDELRDAGLGHVIGPHGGRSNHVASGPGGLAGAVWSMPLPDGKDGPPPLFRPGEQRWRMHPSGRHWVGVSNDATPTPEALLRPGDPVPGEPARLADGGSWIIPVCVPSQLRCMGGMTLPRRYDLADDGSLTGSVTREHEGVAERCLTYFERFVGAAKRPTGDEEAHRLFLAEVDLAAELLGINYRVSRFEAIAVLRVLGDREYHRVLRAAIEADRIDAWWEGEQAKKAEASAAAATSGGASGGATPAKVAGSSSGTSN